MCGNLVHLFPREGALTEQHEFRKYNRLGIARSFTCQTTTHGKHANHTSLVSTISHWYLMNFQVPKLIFWLCFTTLCDLLWKLVTLCQPIKCNTKPIATWSFRFFAFFRPWLSPVLLVYSWSSQQVLVIWYMWSDFTWDNNSVSFTKQFQWVFYLTLHADADFLTNLPLSENDTTPCLNVIGESLSTRCLVISSKG